MNKEVFSFKKNTLESLQIESRRYNVKDDKVPGLRLMVYPSGIKTFILLKRVNDRSQKIKIGRFPELTLEQARNEAKRLNSLITLGQDPHKEKKAERLEITFKELLNIYYADHALKYNKRPGDNKRMMEFHLVPVFGMHKVKTITREKICKIHAQIGKSRGKSGANRVMNVVSSIFNFGIKNGYYNGINPCSGLKKFKSISRDRFLSSEELKLFFEAIKLEDDLFHHFFLLLLYTGARKSNVLTIKWGDIDFNLKRWRIPETQTKNKDVNIVVLSEPALQILQFRNTNNKRLNKPSEFVFPGESKEGYLKDPKKAFQRIRDRMNVQDIRMHDLRRTLGSYMAISGISLPIIGKALNHKSQVSTAIYARLSQNPVEEAVNIAANLMSHS